jgi:type VI secretion system secreted protein VgrG
LTHSADEYANAKENRIVNYYRPDGTLAPDIIALTTGYEKDSTDPNGNIMCQKGSTKVELRHAWNIAIEAQALLRMKIGREIRCDILSA